jgi:hypothetical protein
VLFADRVVLRVVVRRRRRINKDGDVVADTNFVVMLQKRRDDDLYVIDEGVVTAPDLAVSNLDVLATLDASDGRVFTTDGIVFWETDFAIRIAPEDAAFALEQDGLAGLGPLANENCWHFPLPY